MPKHGVHSAYIPPVFEERSLIDAAEAARKELGGDCTAIIAFIPSDWRDNVSDLVEVLQIHGHCPRIFGCSAGGVIVDSEEFEQPEEDESADVPEMAEQDDEDSAPLPGGGASLLFLRFEDTTISLASGAPEPGDGHLILGDPFGDVATELAQWNDAANGAPLYGGLAAGGVDKATVFLFDENGITNTDSLLIRLRGAVTIKGAVSHGCRPIGDPLTITSVSGNVIQTVGNQRSCDVLEETYRALPEDDQEAANGNILVGIAMSEYLEEHQRGDFLISSILGGDPQTGAIAVAATPSVGQTIQFQLRDGNSAHDDMDQICRAIAASKGGDQILGGLLFTCAGRGSHLFGEPDHDASLVRKHLGAVPMAGFFCNGEFAPVGDQVFLHGFTASMAFFVAQD